MRTARAVRTGTMAVTTALIACVVCVAASGIAVLAAPHSAAAAAVSTARAAAGVGAAADVGVGATEDDRAEHAEQALYYAERLRESPVFVSDQAPRAVPRS